LKVKNVRDKNQDRVWKKEGGQHAVWGSMVAVGG